MSIPRNDETRRRGGNAPRTIMAHGPRARLAPGRGDRAAARRAVLGALAFSLVLAVAPNAAANPFLGGDASVPAAPAVASGGQGAFVSLQLSFRDRAGEVISSFREHPSVEGLVVLVLVSFGYGMLHAAGPGHRKTVVFSLFLSRKAAPWEPAAAGFLSAAIHGATGGGLIAVLAIIRGTIASLAETSSLVAWFDAGTFALLLFLSAILAIRKTLDLARGKAEHHRHGREETKSLYGIVAAASAVPCPGAIMILLFALYLDAVWLGVLALTVMSLGMGVVVSAAGYLAWFGRERLFTNLKGRERGVALAAGLMELFAYILVFALSLYALLPALSSLAAGV